MIKNQEILKRFEDDFIRDKGRLSFGDAIKILDAMWNEAVTLGILPPKEPLEEIDVDIRVAKILNSCLKNYSQG